MEVYLYGLLMLINAFVGEGEKGRSGRECGWRCGRYGRGHGIESLGVSGLD